jgi:hypothetical protein
VNKRPAVQSTRQGPSARTLVEIIHSRQLYTLPILVHVWSRNASCRSILTHNHRLQRHNLAVPWQNS